MTRTPGKGDPNDIAGLRGRGTSPAGQRGAGGGFGLLLAAASGIAVAAVLVWFTPLRGPVGRALAGGSGAAPTGGTDVPREQAPAEPEVIVREVPRIIEKRVEVPVPQPPPEMPAGPVRYKKIEVEELFNGIQIRSDLESEEGGIASAERDDSEAYEASFQLRVRVPSPNVELAELVALNPHLDKALVDLPDLVAKGSASRFFHHLYDLKQKQVQSNLTRLDRVLSRHNFYDCDTVLELTHPESGRRAFFVQGEMDVVSDGSDGDRLPELPPGIAESSNFQATTSYGWAKRTPRENPLVPVLKRQLAAAVERYKVRGLTRAENQSLEDKIADLPRVITDLASRSYLVATEDPFVVIPLSTRPYRETDPFIPEIGDYAVVIYGKRLFPAIVGDYGPTTKVGEASLRLAQEINPAATPSRRPVSNLEVSYLIFPGSADRPFGPPDYVKWHKRCSELLAEMGGVGEGYELHTWEDRLAPAEDEESPDPGAEAEPAVPPDDGEDSDSGDALDTPPEDPPADEGDPG